MNAESISRLSHFCTSCSGIYSNDWQASPSREVAKTIFATGNSVRSYAPGRMVRSWRIIQLMPNRSRTWPKREAKNVSSIGIKT